MTKTSGSERENRFILFFLTRSLSDVSVFCMLKLRSTNRRVLLQRGCCQALFCLTTLLAQDVQHVTLSPDGRFVIDGAVTFPIGYTSGPMLGGLSPSRTDALAELKKEGYVFQLWYSRRRQWGPGKRSYL